jgi:hypothetical protein
MGSRRVDLTGLGCVVVGGVRVCHPVHRCGGCERHRAEGADEGLWVPLHQTTVSRMTTAVV